MQSTLLPLDVLVSNKGQLPGLPKNPRFIRDEKFKQLVQSIQDDPEMLDLRELIVFPFQDQYIVIAGNMRFRAMDDLGYKEAPCKILDPSTPVEKLRAYTIKDNNSFGENDWAMLSEGWDAVELEGFGLEGVIPFDMPSADMSNQHDYKSNSEQAVTHLQSGIKKFEFMVSLKDYPGIKIKLEEILQDIGAESNSDAIVYLIRNYVCKK